MIFKTPLGLLMTSVPIYSSGFCFINQELVGDILKGAWKNISAVNSAAVFLEDEGSIYLLNVTQRN